LINPKIAKVKIIYKNNPKKGINRLLMLKSINPSNNKAQKISKDIVLIMIFTHVMPIATMYSYNPISNLYSHIDIKSPTNKITINGLKEMQVAHPKENLAILCNSEKI
jgi:hypothetical protein